MVLLIRDDQKQLRKVVVEPSDMLRWQWVSPSGLFMLPGHPDFNSIKDTSSPANLLNKIKSGEASQIMIQRVGGSINEIASPEEVDEYFDGGEWEERQAEIN